MHRPEVSSVEQTKAEHRPDDLQRLAHLSMVACAEMHEQISVQGLIRVLAASYPSMTGDCCGNPLMSTLIASHRSHDPGMGLVDLYHRQGVGFALRSARCQSLEPSVLQSYVAGCRGL